MESGRHIVALVLVLAAGAARTERSDQACELLVSVDSGPICGAERLDSTGTPYASFRGVPYAQQPLGELRFKELQLLEASDDILNATTEGPRCPQKGAIYAEMMRPQGMSEACIHANVHVPLDALPRGSPTEPGRPILVFIHGGNHHSGSGDADVYGPEYLVSKGIIVITFNYRLNVFGFLSLNTPEIPGNQALRDTVTLLRWVKRNARAFGGNPGDVTLLGHSSGATLAHLLTLSPVSEGLFNRTILMSCTASAAYENLLPEYAANAANSLLASLGINTTDAKEIHDQLVATPWEDIINATWYRDSSFASFSPVVESSFPGVTRIVDHAPKTLIKMGRGKNIPLLIGFTNKEYLSLQADIMSMQLVESVNQNNTLLLPSHLLYTLSQTEQEASENEVKERYFKGNGIIEFYKYIDYASDFIMKYSSMKTALWRAAVGGAAVYLYQFSYTAESNPTKKAYNLTYDGAGHIEDLNYVLRVNSVLGAVDDSASHPKDDAMREWMQQLVINFVNCSNPTCSNSSEEWPAVSATTIEDLQYQDISEPQKYNHVAVSSETSEMINFFDKLKYAHNPTCSNSSEEWPAVSATTIEDLQYQDISEPQKYNHVAVSSETSEMINFFDKLKYAQ